MRILFEKDTENGSEKKDGNTKNDPPFTLSFSQSPPVPSQGTDTENVDAAKPPQEGPNHDV